MHLLAHGTGGPALLAGLQAGAVLLQRLVEQHPEVELGEAVQKYIISFNIE